MRSAKRGSNIFASPVKSKQVGRQKEIVRAKKMLDATLTLTQLMRANERPPCGEGKRERGISSPQNGIRCTR